MRRLFIPHTSYLIPHTSYLILHTSYFILHTSYFIVYTMPDLSDFFKENEDKLQEQPSEQVWQKLEKKLERTHRPKRRGIQFLQLWVVVLLLLILILAAVMVWHYTRQ